MLGPLPKWLDFVGLLNGGETNYPKAPWDVMGCQVATCFKAPGVSLGGSGVSIGGVRSLRVLTKYAYVADHTCSSNGWHLFEKSFEQWPLNPWVLAVYMG